MTRFPLRYSSIGRVAVTVALISGALGASAQQAAGPAQGPATAAALARPGVPMPPPGGPVPAPASMANVQLDGQVARWLTNPNGDVDGFMLADGTQVSFPPHLSARVVDAVKPKDAVKLTGWREGDTFHAASIRGAKTDKVVTDDGPPAMPPTPPERSALQAMSASGRIATQLHGPRGEVNGVVLQSGELVRFPPHVGLQNEALLQKGATLSAQGYGTRNAYGAAFEATALGPDASKLQPVFAPPRPAMGDVPPPPVGAAPAMRPAS